MPGPSKPCKLCPREKSRRSSVYCYWHWLVRQPIELQIEHAQWRLASHDGEHRGRVPKKEWPDGERWCAGCQSFVPDEYARGSRCRACASQASHRSAVARTYGLSEEEYNQLLAWQDGRCYVCGQKPQTRRLAVDHDHRTGAVRGLLCSNDDWGCNRTLARLLNDSDAARRLVEYVELTPMERMRAGQPPVERRTRPVSEQVRRSVLGVAGA